MQKSTYSSQAKLEQIIAWAELTMTTIRLSKRDMIRKSFKICGLNLALDGSEDDLLHNFEYLKAIKRRQRNSVEV